MTVPVAVSADQLEALAEKLRSRNIEVVIVESASEARDEVLSRIPEGSEVHWGKSRTLDELGIPEAMMASERHDVVRRRTLKMDRATQGREIRKLSVAPDIELGSVSAVTADGALIAVSATGSELAAYAAGAGKLILVVGSQKLVPDFQTAMQRINQVVFPYETDRVREQLGVDTRLEKALVIYGEWNPGRTTVILVRAPIGV